MEKKITVKEFVDKYDFRENMMEYTEKYMIPNKYVPYEEKVNSANRIVQSSHYIKTKNSDGKEYKKFHIDSTAKYMLYCLELVRMYSNIEIDFKKSLEQFNMLNSCGALDAITNLISKRELKEFNMILDFVESDLMQNEYEIHSYISNQVERFGELIGKSLPEIIKGLDMNKMSKVIEFIKDK